MHLSAPDLAYIAVLGFPPEGEHSGPDGEVEDIDEQEDADDDEEVPHLEGLGEGERGGEGRGGEGRDFQNIDLDVT